MKRKLFLIIVITLLYSSKAQSQCAMGIQFAYTFDTSTLAVGTRTEMICCLWGNEYMSIGNIVSGNTYTFDSCGATNNIILTLFDSNNNMVAFNNNSCTTGGGLIPSFTASVSGTYKIQVNTAGCGGVSVNTTVSITLESTLGLQEHNLIARLNLFPNPTHSYFEIETTETLSKVEVYSLQGQRVKRFLPQNQYNISDLSSGIYFVNIKTDKGELTKKLIKK